MAVWDYEDTFKFLEAYRNEEELWNPKHEFYKDRPKTKQAWGRISDIMGTPIQELKRKKEALMATFRLHVRRKKASSGEEVIYRPVWVFYHAMEEFLGEVYECPNQEDTINIKEFSTTGAASEESQSNIDSFAERKVIPVAKLQQSDEKSHQSDQNLQLLDQNSHQSDENLNLLDQNSHQSERKSNLRSGLQKPQQSSHRSELHKSHRSELQKSYQSSYRSELQKSHQSSNRPELEETNKQLKLACNLLSSALSKQKDEEDDCELFGNLVAKKLKRLSDDDRQEIMLEIDTLLLNRKRRHAQIRFDFT